MIILESEKEIKYEIQGFENLKKDYLEHSQELQRRHDLMLGVILGLLYGVIGNLFVQFFYTFIEKLVTATHDSVFLVDLVVWVIALAGIILTARKYRNQLRAFTKERKSAQGNVETLEAAIQRRKHQLEQMNGEVKSLKNKEP